MSEIAQFITDLIDELSNQESVPKPGWDWHFATSYHPIRREINLESTFLHWWKKYPELHEKIKAFIAWGVHHEFYHYLKRKNIPHVNRDRLVIGPLEKEANEYAEKKTGISLKQAKKLLDGMVEYVRELSVNIH